MCGITSRENMVLGTTSDFQVMLSLLGLSDVVAFSVWIFIGVKLYVFRCISVLIELFEDCHLWISVYLDHHFWVEMRSTQRSECMYIFFNKFITCNCSLIQFVKQYNNCLRSRKHRERESDAVNFHTVIPCVIKSSIEAQFQHVYTHEKIREVQEQFRRKVNCITRSTQSTLGYMVYEVAKQVSNSIFNKFVVTYDTISS
ncbi:hypothetical protein Ahy_A07g036064 isoform A [Arachis hypogaea]|uniref:Protein FAR1-RELATED SEQUENCE n=1 Tax=Arachis hypogaea TaxID=3818 RepID=A0A445CF60_ARAHY|nr:hypothetical protein Ahy_A07g036064 isoform A [Arachis hypogaea]